MNDYQPNVLVCNEHGCFGKFTHPYYKRRLFKKSLIISLVRLSVVEIGLLPV